MQATLFLSTARPGVIRAERTAYHGGIESEWRIERLLPALDVRCFALDPSDESAILAGTQGEGIWPSVDQGRTWQPHTLEGQTVKSLAFAKSDPRIIYAGLKPPAVWKSTDAGQAWRECKGFQSIPSLPDWWSPAEPPGTAYVQGLAVSPENPDVVLAGIEYGAVCRSADGGQTWTDHRVDAIEDCHTLMFHSAHGEYAYEGGGSGNGGAFSNDGGLTWEQPVLGMDDRHYGWAVAADPMVPTTWYVSVSPGPGAAHTNSTARAAIFRRTKDSEAWEKLGGGLPDPIPNMPYALLTDETAPGHLYAGLRNGDIWFSNDWGDTWRQLPLTIDRIDHALMMITGQP